MKTPEREYERKEKKIETVEKIAEGVILPWLRSITSREM